ncbi:MAG: ABC transporter ATP-binding protein [Pseudomonadota bacterium]
MSSERAASPRRKKSRYPAALRIATTIPPGRSLIVLLCLLGSGAAEGIGIASLIPLIVAAGDSGVGGKKSAIGTYVVEAMQSLGLPTNPLFLLVVLILGMAGKALLNLLAMRQVGRAVAEVGTRMRMKLVNALLDARWSFFVREPLGRFANALGMEAMRASEAYSAVAQFLSHVIQTVIYLGIAAAFSWKLALFATAVGLVMMLSLSRFLVITRRNARKQTKQMKAMIGRLADVLVGLKPMKAMGRQARFGALFAKDVAAIDLAMRKQLFAKHANRALQEPIIFICIGAGIYVALTLTTVPLAELMVMSLLLVKTVAVFGKVQDDLQSVNIAESGYWAIHGTIEDARAAREETTPGRAPTLTRGVEFEAVSMAFGAKRVVERASFMVPVGRVTAIVGASGAGKTTLVDLMLGLHQPTSGRILIDGEPLPGIDVMRWRAMVGYVPQELILFHDTIMANVTLGEPSFTRSDVEHALRQAGAWDFVSQLADGMDHVVGERGGLLSGGQRQRIALARALIHRPRLLILDEATTALDPATEAEIVRNVRALADRDGITVLSISHQPAWMTVADKVIRVQDGHIAELAPTVSRLAAG